MSSGGRRRRWSLRCEWRNDEGVKSGVAEVVLVAKLLQVDPLTLPARRTRLLDCPADTTRAEPATLLERRVDDAKLSLPVRANPRASPVQ